MAVTQKNNIGYRKVETIRINIRQQQRADGTILLQSAVPLETYPYQLTERLQYWATHTPDNIFIARKDSNGQWQKLTYATTFYKVQRIAQALIKKNLTPESPVAILSENSIEHGLMALAALHIGIPYSSIAPAYSLRSADYQKLKHVINLLTPGLILVQDGKKYEAALQAVHNHAIIVAVENPPDALPALLFDELLQEELTPQVAEAYNAIQPHTIAKILFTSGSTGLPKGVINTHENISTNWQQITQTFPFLKEEGLEFIDWLPWNHTFGGNHNFGLTVFNGGSLYIDDGNPTPQGIATTIANLKERKPTIYFNVPKGFEDLLPVFKTDKALRQHFFSNLKMLFYAGAGMPQHVWNEWEQLAIDTIGEKIQIATGLGCTETCPSALFASKPGGFAGLLGVPVPGLELKLVETAGKLEARYRGKNVFPGYWRQPQLTEKVFDEEGYYCTGDALCFADAADANKGMLFDGRIAEDFKLNTGTWVSVGVLRAQLIAAGNGLIQDVVITGHDTTFIGAIIFPGVEYCRQLIGMPLTLAEIATHTLIQQQLQNLLQALAAKSTGSATLVRRAVIADFVLSTDKGELTDKGSVNQRMVLQNYSNVVKQLHAQEITAGIVEVNQ